jgi:glycosyltransferase involved in cell wall biosynthesis
MAGNFRVLMVTSEWPTPQHPDWAPFIVQQVESLRREGITVDVFSFRGAQNPLNYLMAWWRLRRDHNMLQYDLIHAQFGQSGLLALQRKRLPLVVTFRGSDVEGIVGDDGRYTMQGKVLQLISRLVALYADQLIVVSQRLARFLARSDYWVIPSGIDLERFYPRQQADARSDLGLPLDQLSVLFGGNPAVAGKRFGLAQAAVDLIKEHFPNIALIAATGIPHTQMPLYMNASDVLLLTSLHEGSPNTVKEALACNLPIVSTDVGDVRERLGNVSGCIVCADDHPATVATALAQVLAVRMRVDGRNAILDLDEKLATQRVIQVYQQALKHRGRACSGP